MCIMGYLYYEQPEDTTEPGSTFTESQSLLILSFLILIIYILWLYLLMSHNIREYKSWTKRNKVVKLALVSFKESV